MSGEDDSTAPVVTEYVSLQEVVDELLARSTVQLAPTVPAPAATIGPSILRPTFTKQGLQRQYDFNTQILNLLNPIVEAAPEEFQIKASLLKAATLLTQRNELLTVADKDPAVWQSFDHYSQAESFEATNPFLANYLRKRKTDEKKVQERPNWKRPHPYGARDQPFRSGGATWALAPPVNLQLSSLL
ncbi:unnamed protein product [Heligmosomoides polygyrus]|uniref:Mediator complex subunit 8 n=1 Tax=Heligmosomoides polygyrus TaxID=6339 RepID=A0A183FJV0_HELPZ|nr:unnamed protein product [Heligmosomoides polygyrus]